MNRREHFEASFSTEERRSFRLALAAAIATATMMWGGGDAQSVSDETEHRHLEARATSPLDDSQLADLHDVAPLRILPMVQGEMEHDRNPATP